MNDWRDIKYSQPPLGEFVEVIYPDKNRLTDLCRDFAAYCKDNEDNYHWVSEGMDERDWSRDGFRIKYWRLMSPDPKGRKPFLKVDKSGYFRIHMKKVSTND